MEAIVLLVIAYLAAAPDPVTLAATRGAVGAARAARAHRSSTRPARRSSGRPSTTGGRAGSHATSASTSPSTPTHPTTGDGSSAPSTTGAGTADGSSDAGTGDASSPSTTGSGTGSASRWAGVRAAWAGARGGASTARARRAAGADLASRTARTARRAGLVTAGAAITAARAARAGAVAVRTRWTARTNPPAATPADSAVLIGEVINPTTGTGADSMSAPVMDDVPSAAEDVQDRLALSGAGGSNDLKEYLMQTTDLENLPAVRAEVTAASTMCEELAEQIAHLQKWAEGLTDRWSGTAWGTRDLDTAIAGVAEAVSSLSGGEGVMEALSELQDAVTRAEQLGEVVAEHGATGDTRAFAPA